jgi:hypothetical protein
VIDLPTRSADSGGTSRVQRGCSLHRGAYHFGRRVVTEASAHGVERPLTLEVQTTENRFTVPFARRRGSKCVSAGALHGQER